MTGLKVKVGIAPMALTTSPSLFLPILGERKA